MRLRQKMSRTGGFTLLEMLIVLLGVLLVLSFLPALLDVRWLQKEPLQRFNRLEWHVFLQQLKSEVRESAQLETNGTTLYAYKRNGEKVSFERYGTIIRRRVNGQGHETVLQAVADVRYKLAVRGVHIEMITVEGTRYTAFVAAFFPIQVKGA
jgi:competence protein ComGF